MPREILYLRGEPREVLVDGVLGVEPRTVQGVARDVVVVRKSFATRSRVVSGISSTLPTFEAPSARVPHHVRHHRRVRAAVLLVDVLDHFLAAVVLDIESMSGGSARSREIKRSKRRSICTGSTAVIPRQ